MPTIDVVVLDQSEERIRAWNSSRLPFIEPGLEAIVTSTQESLSAASTSNSCQFPVHGSSHQPPKLVFSTEAAKHVREAELIFIAVDTPAGPLQPNGGALPDLEYFHAAVQQVLESVQHDFILVIRSTVPCGTADRLKQHFQATLPANIQCHILSNPEFMAEGSAVQDLLKPDRVVIGCESTDDGFAAAMKLTRLYSRWISNDRIIKMSNRSAELCKLTANTILAQRISTINAISAICEEAGADITEVSRACGMDHRIGPYMLQASPGFGGSCFRKDVLHTASTAAEFGLLNVAEYLSNILEINQSQTQRFIDRIVRMLPLNGRCVTIAVLGFAFKEGTADTRDSPAITIIVALMKKGYNVRVFDPLVPPEQIRQDLQRDCASSSSRSVETPHSVCEACRGAHAIAIVNGWEALRHDSSSQPSSGEGTSNRMVSRGSLNAAVTTVDHPYFSKHQCMGIEIEGIRWDVIAGSMRAPRFIFDGRNILTTTIETYGFQLHSLGRSR